jgi:hypothetical protein
MMKKVLARVPQMRFGYFNRTREQFTKTAGHQKLCRQES